MSIEFQFTFVSSRYSPCFAHGSLSLSLSLVFLCHLAGMPSYQLTSLLASSPAIQSACNLGILPSLYLALFHFQPAGPLDVQTVPCSSSSLQRLLHIFQNREMQC